MPARLRHIAIVTDDPQKAAKFWHDAFGLEIMSCGENAATLSDGFVNLALVKSHMITPQESVEPGFSGLHHIGFAVNDLDGAIKRLQGAQAEQIEGELQVPETIDDLPFEMKWASPDGVIFDLSHTDWPVKAPTASES
jgi:catechol 2,3-dioxygenase-like lactoylglutathione lyase family enzyme